MYKLRVSRFSLNVRMVTFRSLQLSLDGQPLVEPALIEQAWRDADQAWVIRPSEHTAENFRWGRSQQLRACSHLTWQEYFTLNWLVHLSSEELINVITAPLWQPIVQHLVKIQGPSDRLLPFIQQAIAQMLSPDPNLQEFLTWLDRKARSRQSKYRAAAIRAFYFYFAFDLDLAPALALACDLAGAIDPNLAFDLACDLNLDLIHTRPRALDGNLDLDRDLIRVLDRASLLDPAIPHSRHPKLTLALAADLARDLALARDFAQVTDRALAHQLEQLSAKLPDLMTQERFQPWWESQGQTWIAALRQVTIQHRDIGHDWQFTAEQKQQLQRYYDANKFLVELLKIKTVTTLEVRQAIATDLLLPMVNSSADGSG